MPLSVRTAAHPTLLSRRAQTPLARPLTRASPNPPPRSAARRYGNRALALLRLRRWAEAEEDCSAALLLDRSHAKALLRRADAREHLRDWEGSVADLEAVLQLEPSNATAKQRLRAVSAAAREAKLRRRGRPELRRTAAQLRAAAHDPRNDGDPFVQSLAADAPPPEAAAAEIGRAHV